MDKRVASIFLLLYLHVHIHIASGQMELRVLMEYIPQIPQEASTLANYIKQGIVFSFATDIYNL